MTGLLGCGKTLMGCVKLNHAGIGLSLLSGINDVHMPLIYGEGERTFRRLQEEIIRRHNGLKIFAWNNRTLAVLKSIAAKTKDGSNHQGAQQRCGPQRAGTFFKIGRVFAIMEHMEKGGYVDDNYGALKWVTRKGGITIFSHVNRFAVVRERHGFCWAVPLHSYGDQGVMRRGLNSADIQAHAIVYSGRTPQIVRGEPQMTKTPIAIDLSKDSDPWDKATRINSAKVATIEYNVQAMDVGTVAAKSMEHFESYWKQQRPE